MPKHVQLPDLDAAIAGLSTTVQGEVTSLNTSVTANTADLTAIKSRPYSSAYDPVLASLIKTSARTLRGINMAGAEFSTSPPMVFDTAATYKFIAGQGHTLVRLPFVWKVLQPTLSGPLDGIALNSLKTAIKNCGDAGMSVVLDVHDYASRDGKKYGASGSFTSANFCDLWTRIAIEFRHNPTVVGYGIMNEPNGLPTVGSLTGNQNWQAAQQAALNAIRATGDTTCIMISGYTAASMGGWFNSTNGQAVPYITDPINNFRWEAHQYWDYVPGGGSTGSYNTSYATAVANGFGGSVPQSDNARGRVYDELHKWINWLKQYDQKGFIGEFGWPSASYAISTSDAALWDSLAQMWFDRINQEDGNLVWTAAWAAGARWSSSYRLKFYNPTNGNSADTLNAALSNASVLESNLLPQRPDVHTVDKTRYADVINNKSGVLNPTAVQTGAYTANAREFVPVDTTSGNVTITLTAKPLNGTRIGIKMVTQGGSNTVSIATTSPDVFNKTGGSTSVTLTYLNQGIQFQYYNGIWYGIAGDIGLTALDARYATPAYVTAAISGLDDALEYANLAAFPATGTSNTIYIADDTGFLYRWSGSTYIQVGGGTAADATTSSKGIVQLAGDLAGTAASPTVPGLASKAADSAVVHNTGTETIAGVKTFTSAPVVPSGSFPESAVTNLTTDLAARVQVGGDIGGTTTSPTVKRTTRFIVAPFGDTRPADYTCANATANEVEINAALTAAGALTNGGIVDLLDGTFTTSAPIVPLNNTWLRGQGMFNTRVRTLSGGVFNIIDNYSLHSPATPWTNGIISDMELDGSQMAANSAKKGINAVDLVNCKIMRLYVHDTTATGIGADDYQSVTVTENIVVNCGYSNKHAITAASWSGNVLTFTIPSHGYSVGDTIVVAGMVPLLYNNIYKVTSVPNANIITIDATNNNTLLNFTINPGTATTFGTSSDSLIGHNGIGIATGALAAEAMIVTNNYCAYNQNNNFLAEADTSTTGSNASYIFSNNISICAGSVGFLNTGTPNVQFNNNYDFGSLTGFSAVPTQTSKTITAISWSGSIATYTTSTAHGYSVGTQVNIFGNTPAGYNGFLYVASIPTSTTFTVAMTSNPGTATVFGTSQNTAHSVSGTTIMDNIAINNVNYGVRLPSATSGVMVKNNDIKNGYNYGVYSTASHAQISGNRIHGNGRQGIYLVTGNGSVPVNRVDIGNNQVYNNATAYVNTDGITIDSYATSQISDVTIHDNHCFDSQQTQTQRYGIIVYSGGNNANISINNNDLTGNATAGLLLQDTSNTLYAANNLGVNPVGKYDFGTVTGTITVDCTVADFHTVTLGGNISMSMIGGKVKGQQIRVLVTQDATGSRTVSWSGLVSWGAAGAPVLSTTAAATDVFTFAWNGTAWKEATRLLSYVPNIAESQVTNLTSDLASKEPAITTGTTGQYWRGDKSWQTLDKSAVGLNNVSNALQLAAANNLSDVASTATARTNLGLGSLATASTITASQISDSTTAGRALLTAADAAAQTALLNAFTSGLKGLVPASGGGTTNFLRADGTWVAPAGSSLPTQTSNARKALYTDGSAASWLSASPPTTLVVAANNSSALDKARADYVCTGTGDESVINTAITAIAASGGIVELCGGTYNTAATITMSQSGGSADVPMIGLRGRGSETSVINCATNINGITISGGAKVAIRDIHINVLGSGSGIVSTGQAVSPYWSFWDSDFTNIMVKGDFSTHTGYALKLESPFRSTFRNIEAKGIKNGIYLSSHNSNFNPGNCIFERCFMDLSRANGAAYTLYTVDGGGKFNLCTFIQCEAIDSNGTSTTSVGWYLRGSSTTFHSTSGIIVINSNIENFNTCVSLEHATDNDIQLSYASTKSGGTMFLARSNAGGSSNQNRLKVRVSYVAVSSTTVFVDDNSGGSGNPNTVSGLDIYVDTGGTLSIANSTTTIIEEITASGPGTINSRLTSYRRYANQLNGVDVSTTTPATGQVLQATSTSAAAFADMNGSALLDLTRKRPFIFSDFLAAGTSTVDPFLGVVFSSGTVQSAAISADTNHPGMARIGSSTTTNSGAFIGTNTAQLRLGGGEIFECVFYLSTLALSTFWIGFLDTASAAEAVDGVYIGIDSSGVVTGKTSNNSTRSSTGTTYTASASTWYRIRITINSTSLVTYQLFNDSGSLLWTDTLATNIPTASGRDTGAGVDAYNSGTTAVNIVTLDYMAVTWSTDRTR